MKDKLLKMKWFRGLALVAFLAFTQGQLPAGEFTPNIGLPHLEKRGAATQLIVGGKPFLILGGELHNSSASSLEYLDPIWPKLAALNLNTVLATVSWELVEPQEGKLDFALVDGLIKAARQLHLKLVLLWFGSWKNGVSTYVPAWVKKDLNRFPRVRSKSGSNTEALTPLSPANCEADTRAFTAFLRHLRQVDEREQTVLMVQVENEVGTLGQPRDYSALAETAFAKEVPAELMDYLLKHRLTLIPEFRKYWEDANYKTSGSWSNVFEQGADETFMAWHFGRYLGKMAATGKAEYPLPMYVNAWLIQNPREKAGQYPSGGPVSKMLDVWRTAAPAIDFLAPDSYVPDFKSVCASYVRSGNPLFIPETGRGHDAGARAALAIGKYHAIGFCPFGIDSMPPDHPLKDTYALLAELAPLITQSQGTDRLLVVLPELDETLRTQLGDYRLEISFRPPGLTNSPSFGILIAVDPDEYFVAGAGLAVHFSPRSPGPALAGILAVDEGHFRDGKWVPRRRLNGDETGGGWRLQLPAGPPTIQRLQLYRHQ